MSDKLDFPGLALSSPFCEDGLDLTDVAYVKRETMNFQKVYAVYDADGQCLGHTATRSEALLLAERNDLFPCDAH